MQALSSRQGAWIEGHLSGLMQPYLGAVKLAEKCCHGVGDQRLALTLIIGQLLCQVVIVHLLELCMLT